MLKTKRQTQSKKSQAGFTITEMLVVTAIMVLLTGVIVASYRVGQHRKELDAAASLIESDLRRAQNLTMGVAKDEALPEGASGSYGLAVIGAHRYVLYRDVNQDHQFIAADDETIEAVDIEDPVSFANVDLNNPASYRYVTYLPPRAEPVYLIVGRDGEGTDRDYLSLQLQSRTVDEPAEVRAYYNGRVEVVR